jgi:xylan 1,4-beta-xylosidase
LKRLTGLLAAVAALPAYPGDVVRFYWFEYTGRDAAYTAPLPSGSFHNPILAGYYPDPSVTRVGDKYYLVNSTFSHWPGIPVHESRDLVHWKLVGHALSDRRKVSFDGLGTSRGVFAPAIEHHDGVFYVVNTLVDAGGNFFVTARDPAGPWSDPVWLPEIDGIDPSFFFDGGKAYVVNNGPPAGKPLYDGHRAIWIQEFDVAAQRLVGPRKVIVNGGVDLAKRPIWIEGPHLYHVDDWYYLLCAEGGTERNHSAVIFRAKSPWGPFEAYANNPILTQRDLPADRPQAVTNAGHADLVQMQDGSWWAVFLASRPYREYQFNTGRETFLLPVTWKDGWPVILEHGAPIPLTLPGPKVMPAANARGTDALAGNFTQREEFDGELGPEWLTVHVPKHDGPVLSGGALSLSAERGTTLADKRHAGFIARRQQHQDFDAVTEMEAAPPGNEAGLAAFQNESHWYFLGARSGTGSTLEVFLRRAAGGAPTEVTTTTVATPKSHRLRLRIRGAGPSYSFHYDAGAGWQPLRENEDGTILSTEKAGGFVGTVIGPYAQERRTQP